MSRFRRLSHAIWHCQYHLVWVPKYRFRVLEGDVREEVSKCIPFSCINYFRELTERLRSQGSNELFLCILNATTDGFQKHQCNGVSYRYPKAQLDLRPSFYATLGYTSLLWSRGL